VVPEYAGLLVPPQEPAALSAALVEAVGREWDSGRIAAHASDFRWDDNVTRLIGFLQAAARPPRIDSAA
jgi:hypothetical protein